MTLFEALKRDHLVIQQILNQLILINESELLQRDITIKSLELELVAHTRAEEIILYNPLRLADFSRRLSLHGYKEHIEIETLLHLVQLKNAVHINWKETALRLQESLQLHLQEEELEIFELAKDYFSADELESMGQNFLNLKNKFINEGYSDLIADTAAFQKPSPLQKNTNLNPIHR